MDDNGVMELLDELEDYITDSKSVLGNNQRRQIEINPVLDIIEDIRRAFPAEFEESRAIVRERQGMLDSTQRECNRILEDARQQALILASDYEVNRIADQQAQNIIADATERDRAIRAGAEDYADRVFLHVENTLQSLEDNVRRCRERLNSRAV